MTDQELVSVIIPTIGRGSIDQVFRALAAQAAPGPFEVIVVVDGGDALDTSGVEHHPACRRVVSAGIATRSGVSVARNLGAREAHGSVLGFLDDDTVPTPQWVSAVRSLMATGHPAAAVGRIRETAPGALGRLRSLAYDHRHDENSSAEQVERIARRYGLDLSCDCQLVDYLSGGNCCVTAEAFQACAGFDPAYLVGQDRDLGRRLLEKRHHVSYEPSMEIAHRTDSTLPAMLRGRFASGRAAEWSARRARPSAAQLVHSAYGSGTGAIARSAGPIVALLAYLSAFAYRRGLSAQSSVPPNPEGRRR